MNVILGTTDLTLQIHDLSSAGTIIQHTLNSPGLAQRITKVDIVTKRDDVKKEVEPTTVPESDSQATKSRAQLDQEYLAAKQLAVDAAARRAAHCCAPLIQLLNTIQEHGGSLTNFSWTTTHCASASFTRPQTLWSAIFAHTPTLLTLHLDFFEHEVDKLPVFGATFPVLKRLKLDTSNAHGDDGAAIDAILRACPQLEHLEFIWPICDLMSCQIQNISWAYVYPHLTHLTLNGCCVAPPPLARFIANLPLMQVLNEDIEFETGREAYEPPSLGMNKLPQLKALYLGSPLWSNVYFDESARRSISHLALNGGKYAFDKLAKLPRVQQGIKTLELYGSISNWRFRDMEGDEGKARRAPGPQKALTLDSMFPSLDNLQELGIGMSSGNISYPKPDGT